MTQHSEHVSKNQPQSRRSNSLNLVKNETPGMSSFTWLSESSVTVVFFRGMTLKVGTSRCLTALYAKETSGLIPVYYVLRIPQRTMLKMIILNVLSLHNYVKRLQIYPSSTDLSVDSR